MRCTATVCRPRSKRAAKDEDRGHSKSLGLVSRTRRNYRHRDCPGILRGGLVAFACRSCPFHDGGGPFAFWESQFSGLQEDDEVRRSILPSAYRDDDSADAQFHVDHDAEDVAARWEDAQSCWISTCGVRCFTAPDPNFSLLRSHQLTHDGHFSFMT